MLILVIVASFAQALNFILEGSGADFMTLRYGKGNPLNFLLESAPALYYIILATASIAGVSMIISVTKLIIFLLEKHKNKQTQMIDANN